MNPERLIEMANDIGDFFAAEAAETERIEGVRDHLRKFWDPRMRRQLIDHVSKGGQGLSAHVQAAVRLLEESRST